MFCKACGKQLKTSDKFCTSCGHLNDGSQNPVNIQHNNHIQQNTPKPKTNALCMTGFIVGIVSIFLNLFGITGIAAIIFSAIGLNQIKSTNEGGNAFAWVGIGTGIFSVVLGIIAIIALLIMIAAS